MIERRIDHAKRKRVAEMSPEEMRRALLISEKTPYLTGVLLKREMRVLSLP